jgi:hypothetical protein
MARTLVVMFFRICVHATLVACLPDHAHAACHTLTATPACMPGPLQYVQCSKLTLLIMTLLNEGPPLGAAGPCQATACIYGIAQVQNGHNLLV